MSRAMRRQPLVKKPPTQQQSFRPAGARPQKKVETAASVEAKRNRTAYDRFMPAYARDIFAELRKVTWPTREETFRLSVAVIVVSVSIGLALGGVDLGFNWLVEHTILR